MSQKLIKTLSTLVKVEKKNIADLHPTLQELNQKLIEIDEKIENLTQQIEKEKDFLKNEPTTVDFIIFLDRVEKEKKELTKKRKIIFEQYDLIHSQVMEHVKSEKAYTSIQNRVINEIKAKEEKIEEEIIEDIIQMNFLKKIEADEF